MNEHEQGAAAGGKELGFWMSTALVVGNVIGMGIFLLPASLAPYGLNALIGWVITAAGMLVLAQVFAKLARSFPDADGPYAYLKSILGHWPAFVAIWCYWVSLWVTNAALTVGVLGYLNEAVPATRLVPPAVMAVALIWLFILINVAGVRSGGRVQVITTVLKLVPIAAVILLGAWILLTEPGQYARNPPSTPITFPALLAASTLSLYAMLGVESAAVPAGRVRDAARTIPRATMTGTLLVAGIYISASAVVILLIEQHELAKSSAPFADLLERYTGHGSGRWLAGFVVISGLGCLNGWTLLLGELTASMAKHGVLPRRLAAYNSSGAPAAALVVTGVLASAMVLMNYSKSLVEGFTFLTLVVTAANLPIYLCCALALAVFWKRQAPSEPRNLLVLGLLGTAYSIFAFVGLGREPFLWSLALAMAGVPIYVLMRARQR